MLFFLIMHDRKLARKKIKLSFVCVGNIVKTVTCPLSTNSTLITIINYYSNIAKLITGCLVRRDFEQKGTVEKIIFTERQMLL